MLREFVYVLNKGAHHVSKMLPRQVFRTSLGEMVERDDCASVRHHTMFRANLQIGIDSNGVSRSLGNGKR